MTGAQLYDALGASYTATRRTEPRIAGQIWAALGDARTLLNVGAGTGSVSLVMVGCSAAAPQAE